MSENNNSRQLTILTIAAVVMSVASLITAVAALYTLKYGNERDEARIARLAAVMEENAAKKTTTTAATSTRKTGASTSASATSSRAATSSSVSTSRAQASALARTPEPTARAGQAQGTAAQTQPQQAIGQAAGAGQVAAQTRQTTVATEEQLLAIGAATDPGASPVDRAEWAADGKTARTTLSEIVRMRNTTGQPSLDVTDIVQTGDRATATITVAFPGNWGSWTFPDSGFQYVDGKWKLQKSAVCSLAQASLTKCY